MSASYGRWLFVRAAFVFCLTLSSGDVAAQKPPQILDLTYRPEPFHVESGIEVLPKVMRAEKSDVSFSCRWFVNGEEVEGRHDLSLPGVHFQRGDRIAVEVTPARDGQQGAAVRSGEVEAGNAPPRFVSLPPENFIAKSYRYQLEAVDVDDDMLSYQLLEAPTGMQIDGEAGMLTWTVEQWPAEPIVVTITVEDGYGGRDRQQFIMNPTFKQDEGSAHE